MVTGGIITVKDSAWLMSYTFNRQGHFKAQPANQLVGWIYGLYPNRPGDFVKKPMRECTGEEIAAEWLYHMGVPEDQIADLAANSVNCVPCIVPYITAFFMPRTAMEAVYTLLNVDRGVPEVFSSCYDVQTLLDAMSKMMDGKKLVDVKLPLVARVVEKVALRKISYTMLKDLLVRYELVNRSAPPSPSNRCANSQAEDPQSACSQLR